MEKSGNFNEASEKFSQVLELQPGHSQAVEFLQKINAFGDSRKRPFDVIELDKDEEENTKKEKTNGFNNNKSNQRDESWQKQKESSISEEEAKRNSSRLKEMEEFIQKLKSGK